MLNYRNFTDIVQMEMAVRDIGRYQQAYIKANNVTGIMVKWQKGWFAIRHPSTGVTYHRPTEFQNMIDRLESRCKRTRGE